MIDTDKYGDMTMKDITAPIDEETGEPQQIPARWKVKLCWTGAYNIVGGGEVICNLTGNKDSANRKEWAELIADAPKLLAEVKRLREAISDIARSMDAADPVYLQGFIKDLYEVIE
tara:strand:- start:28 stop:375 length:348 start_codon:yes stop_codon:yes gene_type:complete